MRWDENACEMNPFVNCNETKRIQFKNGEMIPMAIASAIIRVLDGQKPHTKPPASHSVPLYRLVVYLSLASSLVR